MATIIEKTGKTVEEAIQAALAELNVSEKDIEVEVLESPSKGFLGFGKKPARIKVTLKENSKPAKIENVSEKKILNRKTKIFLKKKFLARKMTLKTRKKILIQISINQKLLQMQKTF